jgi:hypothetical protein
MSEIKPTECTVCEPWGFSAESDKARARCCPACAGTGLVYALPDTHRIVSVDTLEHLFSSAYYAEDEALIRAIIDKETK